MSALLIQLIINLLGMFLKYLFEQWLAGKPLPTYQKFGKFITVGPSPDFLAGGKEYFLKKISWRFWLGPMRNVWAEKLFDNAVKRYHEDNQIQYKSDGTTPDVDALVKRLTNGLTVD